jgi:hypothetical protein
MIEDFRQDYNRYRPHRAHRMMTPTAFRTGWETAHEAPPASAELRRRWRQPYTAATNQPPALTAGGPMNGVRPACPAPRVADRLSDAGSLNCPFLATTALSRDDRAYGTMTSLLRRFWRRGRDIDGSEPTLAFPYYVDSGGLRLLADSLGIDVPVARETASARRVTLDANHVSGEKSRSDTARFEGHIHLNRLAAQLKASAAYREVADVLGQIPQIRDLDILSAAITLIPSMPADEVAEGLTLAYKTERQRTIMSAKRAELSQVAQHNQLVILRGTFEKCAIVRAEKLRAGVRLTHLESNEVAYSRNDEHPGRRTEQASEMPMPEGVGVHVVLPSPECFTAAGTERLERGASFYAQVIAHSASFDDATGVLTCSAYALWGMPRPSRLLDYEQRYEFLEAT